MKTSIARLFLILSAATLLCLPTQIFASVSNDQVLSQHVKEADGTSGQNTNTGSGIKTGHIQNGAVTDSKITGPISGSKLGSHVHSGSDITDGAITTPKIADGAVTPSKIGFYRNVIIVAPSGGDFTSPVDAMNAIIDASATNPYLVKIMPGVYDIGSNSVQMKEYVDIEGSGENNTKITGIGASGIIRGASNAEIRFLTLASVDGGGTKYGINNYGASPKITNVTIQISGGGSNYGITNTSASSPYMNNITVEISGGSVGVGVDTSNNFTTTGIIIINSRINVNSTGFAYGIYSGNSPVVELNNVTVTAISSDYVYSMALSGSHSMWKVANSTISSNSYGLGVDGPTAIVTVHRSIIDGYVQVFNSATLNLALTQVDGAIWGSTATVRCYNVYDANFTSVVCP